MTASNSIGVKRASSPACRVSKGVGRVGKCFSYYTKEMVPVSSAHTIALFGATGRTGRHVLEQVLAAGCTARVLARKPGSVAGIPGRITVILGDVLDRTAVDETVRGADAVVSVFGHVAGSPSALQTEGTRNIVDAMKTHTVARVVSLSGGGLPVPQDKPKAADHIIRFLLERLSPQVLRDAHGHLDVLRASGLDWTVVRAPRLTDASAVGSYRVGWVGVNASTQIARADLATCIVAQIDDRTFVHQLPFVSR